MPDLLFFDVDSGLRLFSPSRRRMGQFWNARAKEMFLFRSPYGIRCNVQSVQNQKIQLSTAKLPCFSLGREAGSMKFFFCTLLSIYHPTGRLSSPKSGQFTVKDKSSVINEFVPRPTSEILVISYTFNGS